MKIMFDFKWLIKSIDFFSQSRCRQFTMRIRMTLLKRILTGSHIANFERQFVPLMYATIDKSFVNQLE